MMRPDDVVAYAYRADLYCAACMVVQIGGTSANTDLMESALDHAAATLAIDRRDERSFDSDDFPKVVFRDQVQADDRCGGCGLMLQEVSAR